jgi:hypothetical protein
VPGQRVGDHDDPVFELGCVSSRRLTTDVRDGAHNRNSVYAAGVGLLLQVALAREEGAGAGFNGDEVLLFLLKPVPQREKHRLTSGVRLQITETNEGLVLSPIRRARPSAVNPEANRVS